jgi:hypothetical protein
MMWITKHEIERENRMVLVRILFFILFTVLTFTLIASASAQPLIPTPPLPPIFTDLNITPAEIEPGNEVTISFTITNSDNQTFNYTVNMQIGELNFPIDVELEAYESKTVSRTITQYIPGDYNVTIDSLEGTFTVKFHDIPTPPLPPILSNLIITPDELKLGDEVTINFDIENYGSSSQTYGVDIHIENVNDPPPTWPPYDITMKTWVDLGAYEFKTVFFTITMDTGGDFNVTVHGMTASFKVGTWPPEPPLRPAELVLSDLSIEPEEAELWEGIDDWTFRITVNVTNVGGQEGMDTINLRVDGSIVDRRTVKLGGGEKVTIMYDVTRGVGSYIVEVDGFTGGFTVKAPPKPAEFEFSDMRIFYPGVIPPEVEAGQTVTVTVSIEAENVGELEGIHTVELKVDGEVVDSKGVTLEGGASTTVLFELTRGEGTHEVEVEGFTDSFTVNPKPSFWDKIPGFPYESIILGLLTGVFVLWLLSRRKITLLSPRNHILSFS